MRAVHPAASADETELPALEEERRINAVQESIPAVRGMEPPRRCLCRERVPGPISSLVGPYSSPGSIPLDPTPWPGTSSLGIPRPALPGRPPPNEDRDLVPNPGSPLAICASDLQTLDPEPALLPEDAIARPASRLPVPIQAGLLLALRNPSRRRCPWVLRP